MRTFCALVCLILAAGPAHAGLVLNEYNAVGSTKFLKNDNSDSYLGRIEGNGGNWIELVVTSDHLDVRNWELRWYEKDAAANGTAIWDPTRTVVGQDGQGVIAFSNDSLWSDLRIGTVLTISESMGTVGTRNFDTDTSFDMSANDWWLHVSTTYEASQASPLFTTTSNLTGGAAGSFSVGNDNWELTIFDPSSGVVQGPIGEATSNWGGGGVGSDEVGKLEYPESPATLADWDTVLGSFYRDGSSSTFGSANAWSGGLFTQDLQVLRDSAAVPEASSFVMAGLGCAACVGLARKRKRYQIAG